MHVLNTLMPCYLEMCCSCVDAFMCSCVDMLMCWSCFLSLFYFVILYSDFTSINDDKTLEVRLIPKSKNTSGGLLLKVSIMEKQIHKKPYIPFPMCLL